MSYLIFPPPPPPPSPPFTAMTRPIFPRSSSSGATSFPIIAVAVIGILATGFLLVSYYIFVIKCCLNWHQIDIFRRRRRNNDQNSNYSPHELNKGLDESAIRAIPIFNFKKRNIEEEDQKNSQECSVCLNEFQEDEKLRIIPNCCHMFHIDCIDVWLQTNANCPLCRTSVSCDTSYPFDIIPAPSSSPDSNHPPRRELEPGVVFGGDNDFVVIELGTSGTSNGNRESAANRAFLAEQERLGSRGVVTSNIPRSISPFLGKFDRRSIQSIQKNGKKLQNMKSMGDECIDIRDKDDQFGESVKPIRRSISMDSSADRELYLAVQEAINRKIGEVPVVVTGEECSSSSNRVKRCFFSFGSNRGSNKTSSVYLEP